MKAASSSDHRMSYFILFLPTDGDVAISCETDDEKTVDSEYCCVLAMIAEPNKTSLLVKLIETSWHVEDENSKDASKDWDLENVSDFNNTWETPSLVEWSNGLDSPSSEDDENRIDAESSVTNK